MILWREELDAAQREAADTRRPLYLFCYAPG